VDSLTTTAVAVRTGSEVRAERLALLRVEKAKISQADRALALESLKTLLGNPVVELLIGWSFLAYTKSVPGEGFWSNYSELVADTAGATAITGVVGVQQLAPSLPYLAQSGDLMKMLGPLLAVLPK